MRKLIDDDGNGRGKGLGADIDLLMKSSRNVPKNSSFLKRDLVLAKSNPNIANSSNVESISPDY